MKTLDKEIKFQIENKKEENLLDNFAQWNGIILPKFDTYFTNVEDKNNRVLLLQNNYCQKVKKISQLNPILSLEYENLISNLEFLNFDYNIKFLEHIKFVKNTNLKLINELKEKEKYYDLIDLSTGENIPNTEFYSPIYSIKSLRFLLGQIDNKTYLEKDEIEILLKRREFLKKEYAISLKLDYNQNISYSPQELLLIEINLIKAKVARNVINELSQDLPKLKSREKITALDFDNLYLYYEMCLKNLFDKGYFIPEFDLNTGKRLNAKERYLQYKKFQNTDFLFRENAIKLNLCYELKEFKNNPKDKSKEKLNDLEYLNLIYQFRNVLIKYLVLLPDMDKDSYRKIKEIILGNNIKIKDDKKIEKIWNIYIEKRQKILNLKKRFQIEADKNNTTWEEEILQYAFGKELVGKAKVYIRNVALIFEFEEDSFESAYNKLFEDGRGSDIAGRANIDLDGIDLEKQIIILNGEDQETLIHELQHMIDVITFNNKSYSYKEIYNKLISRDKIIKDKDKNLFYILRNDFKRTFNKENEKLLKGNFNRMMNHFLDSAKTEIFAYLIENNDSNAHNIGQNLQDPMYDYFTHFEENELNTLRNNYSFSKNDFILNLLKNTKESYVLVLSDSLKVLEFLESKKYENEEIISMLTPIPLKLWKNFVLNNFPHENPFL